ncbi:mannose-6-phosphate isomerase, type 2 [Gloeocapsa sp. PCC 7428]|uniref:glycosyltransferase family 4 protein n=1 Tax=Gloeocapsa sp. PCC 7428 TaxID=1173026 RepID=UPI0002A5BCA4|nr:glycosyltransferase family 4 protein [Gloeocapsa sp. PCC 7428]AFZ29508.1 mannose-6-phosphate isomerase, type 2 [Gloeocapsa sp. PCC 7428]
MDTLRIALISPIAGRTGPDSGSSIEQIVSLLTEELMRRGHKVTLFATGDSQTSALLHAVYARGYRNDPMLWNNYEFHEVVHVAAAFERAQEFDVIHSHAYHYALPFTRLVPTPIVHTYHINPNSDILRSYTRYPEAQVVAVSRYHRSKFKSLGNVPVIYNGIDTAAFPFCSGQGDYLVFLGHLNAQKGAVEAIKVTQKVGMRLIMAGQGQGDYFETEVAPLIDGKSIEYIGPVGVEKRNELLAGAAALLFPINYSEAFGMVLIEAMACGTPVLASDRCAVSEIVEPGVTGYYAADVDSLAACLPDVLALDRTRVRQAVVARFDYHRMVDEYEALYRKLLEVQR